MVSVVGRRVGDVVDVADRGERSADGGRVGRDLPAFRSWRGTRPGPIRPAWLGKLLVSRSVAFCDSTPGTVNLSTNSPPADLPTANRATTDDQPGEQHLAAMTGATPPEAVQEIRHDSSKEMASDFGDVSHSR